MRLVDDIVWRASLTQRRLAGILRPSLRSTSSHPPEFCIAVVYELSLDRVTVLFRSYNSCKRKHGLVNVVDENHIRKL